MRKYIIPIVCGLILIGAISFIFLRNLFQDAGNYSEGPLLKIDTPDVGYLYFPVWIVGKSTAEVFTFDPTKGEKATISYSLTRDGDIRIRVVCRDQKGLVIRTILDWTHQDFGKHLVKWDGRDASGNIVDNKRCFIEFAGDSELHKKHEREKCKDLSLKITSPVNLGEVIIGKLSEIGVKILDTNGYWQKSGYEVRVYIDYVLAYKASSMTKREFHLRDIDKIESGKHLVTINVDDGQDHIGTAGIKVKMSR